MKDKTAALAKKAINGDAEAFGELYSHFSAEMYRYALYHLGSRESAQDALQEAALEAFKGIGRLKNESAAKAWFFSILCSTCKHSLREKYRADITPLDLCAELSSDDNGDDISLGIDLLRLIAELDEQSREIVLLSVLCGYTSKEIAKIICISHNTVRSKLSRTLAKLRLELETGGRTQ